MTTSYPFDVAIIGGGPAGLSAALVLARARRTVAVIDGGHPRNAPASHMHGFLSRDGTPPGELVAAGRAEIARYGAHLLVGDVARARRGFVVDLADGRQIACRRLVLATGVSDDLPIVAGLRARWGADVLHCPYCHGWEVRDQPLCVIGHRAGSVQHALLVRQWSADVTYVTHTSPPTDRERAALDACGIRIVDARATTVLTHRGRFDGIGLADGAAVACAAVFVRPSPRPNTAHLLDELAVAVDADGFPVVDHNGRTDVPGVWAIGNLADPRMQVISAVGSGSTTAIDINSDLVDHGIYAQHLTTSAAG